MVSVWILILCTAYRLYEFCYQGFSTKLSCWQNSFCLVEDCCLVELLCYRTDVMKIHKWHNESFPAYLPNSGVEKCLRNRCEKRESCIYICIYTCIHAYTYMYVYMCLCAYVYMRIRVHAYVRRCLCAYIHICMCAYVYMRICFLYQTVQW